MKTTIKAYYYKSGLYFYPTIEVADNEIAAFDASLAACLNAQDAAEKEAADWYDAHRANCSKQTWKNKKKKIFEKHLKPFVPDIFKRIAAVRHELSDKIKESLDSVMVEINYDGRKKNNLPSIMRGVEMALNLGGAISPQYAAEGLRGFKVKN